MYISETHLSMYLEIWSMVLSLSSGEPSCVFSAMSTILSRFIPEPPLKSLHRMLGNLNMKACRNSRKWWIKSFTSKHECSKRAITVLDCSSHQWLWWWWWLLTMPFILLQGVQKKAPTSGSLYVCAWFFLMGSPETEICWICPHLPKFLATSKRMWCIYIMS